MQSISENSSFCSNSSLVFPGQGGDSPLDLFIGHLRTDDGQSDSFPFPSPQFVPFLKNSSPVTGWFRRPGSEYQENPYIAKIQPFVSGGYEVTITKVDLEKVGRAMDGRGRTGKREKREQNVNDVITSKKRARRTVRHKIKSMGADRLLTLSRREVDDFFTVDQWAAAWKKFCRLCRDAGIDLAYVAVLETHKKGNYHLHAAIVGNINVKTIRRFWFICLGGRGNEKGALTPGNVDISFKHSVTDHKRRAGVAKYVSKYISKQDHTDFNKKRYWSSRHKLPPCIRYELRPCDLIGYALVELAGILGLDAGKLLDPKYAYIFGSQVGAWFTYDDALLNPVPF